MGTSTGRLRDPVVGSPGDQMMGRRSYMFFKFDLRVCGKVLEKVDTSKNLSYKYLSKPLWRSTF